MPTKTKKTPNKTPDAPVVVAPAEPPEKNGSGERINHKQIRSASDLVFGEKRGESNPAEALIKFPLTRADWLSNTTVNMEEIQALVGMEEEDQATEWGRGDSREINWMYLGLKNSLAGRGRQMFANVLTSVYKQVTGFMDRLTGGPGQSGQNNAQGDGRQN